MTTTKSDYFGPLWDWKAMMHERCTEGPEDLDGIATCRLPSGTFVHRGLNCDGCRYKGPRNLY